MHEMPKPWPRGERIALVAIVLAALVLSGVQPHDRLTWFMEVVWVIVGLPLVVVLWPRFPLTRLLGWLLALHALVLIYGGAYTYALTPLGLWLQEALDLARNHYDRFGHLMQGLVPALLTRELLRRNTPLRPGGWLGYLCIAAALSFSAFFEMLEWWAALIWGGAADAFLATQGDVWDTQWDMFCALLGATLAVVLLSRVHERQLG